MIWAPPCIWLPVRQACHPQHEYTRFRGTCLFRKDGLTVTVYFGQIAGEFIYKLFVLGGKSVQLVLGVELVYRFRQSDEKKHFKIVFFGIFLGIAVQHPVDVVGSKPHGLLHLWRRSLEAKLFSRYDECNILIHN